MRSRHVSRLVCTGLLAALVSGCALLREPALPPVSENPAVLDLVESARTDSAQGKFPAAVATLERALRIESRNASLWHELASVRLQEGNPEQAESLAQRSNAWAGTARALRAANWRLIAEARSARGDTHGAEQALKKATGAER
jgi:predicted Zn-dependent protease